jgi:microtubule-associated protein-like 6
MSVRPWIGQIIEPNNHNPINNDPPEAKYELKYVYGYRCADSKQNVYFNASGKAVYMTAALGVVLDTASNTQAFFGGGEVENTAKNVANDQNHHTDDVMCVRVSPDRTTAVSGQNGSKPTIFTWDADTGAKKQRIKIAKGARGITACAINSEGWICAVDLHNEHQVYVYDQNGQCIFKQKGDTNKIHDCCWDAKPGSKRFSTSGVKHMYFWDAGDRSGDKKKGLFGSNEQTSFACTAWDENGKCYSGGSNGKIYVWGGDDGR